ncbi:MAG: tRNA (adenosine(37)-N6)-threonylcarbamoyltransferase complex transferase subunit TsaD [Chloroflexota bacterium]|nr:tRNA (adenosine(37)-N6)-threonylcarbamoyltransferase complex transferase subunit TsaD [Chloroflexota bacterium]
MPNVLAIETSCDETSCAVARDGRHVLSNVTSTQEAIHRRFGGIVPEVASREHLVTIVPVLEEAVEQAGGWQAIDAVAAVYGPGLAGSLLVGVNVAKAIAFARDLPLIGINHLEGHIYANWIAEGQQRDRGQGSGNGQPPATPDFPVMALIASGGHTELVLMEDHGRYRSIGQTRDDAAGEAFDKTARLLGLGYPGGPAIQQAAEGAAGSSIGLPRAWMPNSYDFSFSGLKTAVLRLTSAAHEDSAAWTAAVAAEFQQSIVDVLVGKTVRAAEAFGAASVCLAGGVAANKPLREQLRAALDVPFYCPRISLCTDNAAMSAAAGYFHLLRRDFASLDLDVVPGLRLAA